MIPQEGDQEPLAPGYCVASSFECSIRPSRQQSTTSDSNHIHEGIFSLSAPLETRTSFQIMLEILRSSGLPKLVTINRQHQLGQGAQFAVYQETVEFHKFGLLSYENRAVRQAKFENSLHTQFTLQNREARAHLSAVCLEILALPHSEIRGHPNVVKLLGWGTEQGFFSPHPCCGTCDRLKLCVDISAGLHQLHSCGLIHGDLKPQNVLIFEGGRWPVAKLADFGLSTNDSSVEGVYVHIGGTPGWQAPEIEKGNRVDSTLCLEIELLERPTDLSRRMTTIFDSFGFGNIEEFPIIAQDNVEKSHFDYIDSSLEREHTYESLLEIGIPQSMIRYYPFDQPRYKSWELAPSPAVLFSDIFALFCKHPENVSEYDCFSLFLGGLDLPQCSYSKPATIIRLVFEAARRGLNVARSLVPVMHRYYDIDVSEATSSHLLYWLKSAVEDGNFIARSELERIAYGDFHGSIEKFQNAGGYNQIYSKYLSYNAEVVEESKLEHGWNMLHYLSAYGAEEEVKEYLKRTDHVAMNALTKDKETALYLASLRGSHGIMQQRLLHGSDPSIPCTEFEITCMHWLFSFHENIQDEIVMELTTRGADIDARAKWGLPFLYYPFILPEGSPLHWAIHMASRSAMKTLVKHGASVSIRDGSNPYTFDQRIRVLLESGGCDEENYSVPEKETMGLSPLDVSALQWDS
ncbi:hypothetical protein GQ44DRAFT_725949 [Phaeosphaeriaceae sp. PMI808]|nr:hypothetical protein GQ44DRAFT_725949 [Phaeosphaeriaceae sp. PMI808]